MFVIASMVDTVTTPHEHYSLRRCKHVLAAYRAITVSRTFDAAMGVLD